MHDYNEKEDEENKLLEHGLKINWKEEKSMETIYGYKKPSRTEQSIMKSKWLERWIGTVADNWYKNWTQFTRIIAG